MKSITLLWCVFVGCVVLLCGTGNVNAWNRQYFNRFARQLNRRGSNSVVANTELKPNANTLDELNALFGFNNDYNGRMNVMDNDEQQQPEVYGIVEPLIEDMPCMDRPCNTNDDCCPTGVCVNTYGEGKCIYVYGRKRDQCQRNSDCGAGMSCVRSEAGNMVCKPAMSSFGGQRVGGAGVEDKSNAFELKGYGEECVSSFECQANKNMCCQLQRNHHRLMPKQVCNYAHDPFMCIDLMPQTDNEDLRDARLRSVFSQRRM